MTAPFDTLPPDYRDMLALLHDAGAEFVVVGGWAMAAHGHQRSTKDLDVFVRPSLDNAPRVVRALQAFGAPLHGLTAADFARAGPILQVGASLRIDITTTIEGVDFDEARRDAITVDVDGMAVPVIGRDALVKNKRASGRAIDRLDVRRLEGATTSSGPRGAKGKAPKKKPKKQPRARR